MNLNFILSLIKNIAILYNRFNVFILMAIVLFNLDNHYLTILQLNKIVLISTIVVFLLQYIHILAEFAFLKIFNKDIKILNKHFNLSIFCNSCIWIYANIVSCISILGIWHINFIWLYGLLVLFVLSLIYICSGYKLATKLED